MNVNDVPSPIEVTSWPQVAALALILLAFVTVPAILGYLQLKATRSAQNVAAGAQDTATAAAVDSAKTLAAVTKKNGGNSMPDRFDKTDRLFAEVFDRLDKIEGVPRAVAVTPHRVELEKGTDR